MKNKLIAALFAVSVIGNSAMAVTDAKASNATAGNQASTAADQVVKFITMEEGHKSKWFDFEKGHSDAKIDLMKKQHTEKMDLAKTHITKLGKGVPTNQYFADKLHAMISLHKKHMDEWKALCQTWEAKARELGEKERAELARFEQSL